MCSADDPKSVKTVEKGIDEKQSSQLGFVAKISIGAGLAASIPLTSPYFMCLVHGFPLGLLQVVEVRYQATKRPSFNDI